MDGSVQGLMETPQLLPGLHSFFSLRNSRTPIMDAVITIIHSCQGNAGSGSGTGGHCVQPRTLAFSSFGMRYARATRTECIISACVRMSERTGWYVQVSGAGDARRDLNGPNLRRPAHLPAVSNCPLVAKAPVWCRWNDVGKGPQTWYWDRWRRIAP